MDCQILARGGRPKDMEWLLRCIPLFHLLLVWPESPLRRQKQAFHEGKPPMRTGEKHPWLQDGCTLVPDKKCVIRETI